MEKKDGGRPFDVIIFGASGFTGKYVLREYLNFVTEDYSGRSNKIGIGGRSLKKLEDALNWAGSTPSQLTILIADVDNHDSLISMCSQTRLLIDCVGPFRLYGEPVVNACIKCATHYVDICGEPEFMERMEMKYGELAKEKNTLVISACAFDSVPADMGVLCTSKLFDPDSIPSTIDSYLSVSSRSWFSGNFGTWASLIQGIANAESLRKLRKSKAQGAKPIIFGKNVRPKTPFYSSLTKSWVLPFPSSDASVVKRTAQALWVKSLEHSSSEPTSKPENTFVPVHYNAYFLIKSRFYLYLFMIMGFIFQLFASSPFGRKLLLKFPRFFSYGLFSHEGPTEKQVKDASFNMLFVAKGYSKTQNVLFDSVNSQNLTPHRQIITRISGPDPGYLSAAIIAVQCSSIILEEKEKLTEGGVFTPGAIFANSDLMQRLGNRGIQFSVLKDEVL